LFEITKSFSFLKSQELAKINNAPSKTFRLPKSILDLTYFIGLPPEVVVVAIASGKVYDSKTKLFSFLVLNSEKMSKKMRFKENALKPFTFKPVAKTAHNRKAVGSNPVKSGTHDGSGVKATQV